ncbi:MAG TPA: DUF2911 domain-containing protein [Terriglobales bacterium]|nr:DUF2911 domain-containing protein [Terriglobales bacterium]
MKTRIAILLCTVFALSMMAAAQMGGDKPRPSPAANAQCKFADGHSIKVAYSSPRAKGRKIYGELVPFGQVWRTGANESTTFVTDASLTIGGKDVPAGSYTMFTEPGQDKWSLIISKKTGEWGTDYPKGEDLGRYDMSVSKTAGPVENFTISFHEMGTGCHMYMDWESTRATVEITEKK